MGRHLFAVVSDEPVPGKYCAYHYKFTQGENLVWLCRGHKTFNIMPTLHEAMKTAEYWNKCYKENGTLALEFRIEI